MKKNIVSWDLLTIDIYTVCVICTLDTCCIHFIVFASTAHMETPFVKSLFVSFRVALAESDHQGPKKGS